MHKHPLLFALALQTALACGAEAPHRETGAWESCAIGGGGYLQRISIPRSAPERLYLATDVGGAYRSDDGGRTWRMLHGALPPGEGASQVRGILAHPEHPDRVLLAAGSQWSAPEGVFRSDDGGEQFTRTLQARFECNGPSRADGEILAADPTAPDTVLAAAVGDGLYRSDDFGRTWRPLGLEGLYPTGIVIDRTRPGAARLWVLSKDPGRRAPGNAAWRTGLFRTDDGGATWQRFDAPGLREFIQDPVHPERLHGLFTAAPQFRFSDDGGATWQCAPGAENLPEPDGPRSDGTYAALAAGPDFLIAGAHGGTFYRLDCVRPDSRWTCLGRAPAERIREGDWYARLSQPIEPHFGAALGFVAIAPDNPDRWYFTDWYACYRSDDAGKSWDLMIDGIEMTVLHCLAQDASAPHRCHAGAADVGYFQSFDGGKTFSVWGRRRGISNNVRDITVCAARPSRLYAVAPRTWRWFANQVFRSDDAGLSWRRPAARGLPDLSDEKGERCNSIRVHPRQPDELLLTVSGAVAPPDRPGAGGVWRSTDGGESFVRYDQGLPAGEALFRKDIWTTRSEVAIAPDGTAVAVSHDRGRAFVRAPGDAVWRERTAAHGLPPSFRSWQVEADPHAESRFFAALRDKGLYESADGGATWRRLEAAGRVWGFAVDQAVPGRLAVCDGVQIRLSEDGGKSFRTLPEGPPLRTVRSVLCFAGDYLLVGTPGSGIFRTRIAKTPEPPETAPLTAEILFEETPVERGLTFERTFATPERVTAGGETVSAWKIRRGADPARGWMRVLRCTFTDPAWMGGNMPVLEGEVEYLHRADTTVEAVLNTADGPVRGGGRFGASDAFRTFRFAIDTGRFTVDGVPDLAVQAANEDWFVRRITVRGFERTVRPDFSRLVQLESLTATDRPVFLYEPGEPVQLEAAFANRALRPFRGTLVHTLTPRPLPDSREAVKAPATRVRIPLAIPAEGRVTLPLRAATDSMPLGICDNTLTLLDETGTPVLEHAGTIGFAPDAATPPPKAKPGEFLYGLDLRLGRADTSPELMAWTRHLGADLIRHGLNVNRPEEAREAIRNLRAQGLDMLAVLDVPKETDEAAFRKSLARTAAFAAAFAADGKPPFWELGNEPDLSFFFPAGMARYLEGLAPLARAIREADPGTCILNGGLANASHRPESAQRVAAFFRGLEPGVLSRIAYHAHGFGAAAEANALRRMNEAAAEAGKTGLLWADTETGMAASGPEQERLQAVTCVQKFVFAQAQRHPFLIWFRLHFEHPESYGSLRSLKEPRPAALAYRQLVRTLRGHAAATPLPPAAGGEDGLSAWCFAETDGGAGRVLVAWSESDAPRTLRLDLGPCAGAPRLLDLFGNARPLVEDRSGLVEFSVTRNPVYLCWKTADPAARPAHAAPMLALKGGAQSARLQPGGTTHAELLVHNPLASPLEATLTLTADSVRLPLSVEPATLALTLAPGETQAVPATLTAGAWAQRVRFDALWRLAGPIAAQTARTLAADPEKRAAAADAASRWVAPDPRDGSFPLDRWLGGFGEGKAALLTTHVVAEEAQTVTVGASADWWMAWFLNGKPVFDTLRAGNGSVRDATAHAFELPLARGTNELTAIVLSGSQGFRLAFAPPEILRTARERRAAPEVLQADLHVAHRPPTRLAIPLDPGAPGRAWPGALLDALPLPPTGAAAPAAVERLLTALDTIAPDFVPPESALHNRWTAEPDASRWWKGPDDLSARLWRIRTGDADEFLLCVRDDVHTEGDRLELLCSGEPDRTATVRLRSDGTLETRPSGLRAAAARVGACTLYRIRSDAPGVAFRICDADAAELKQTLEFAP